MSVPKFFILQTIAVIAIINAVQCSVFVITYSEKFYRREYAKVGIDRGIETLFGLNFGWIVFFICLNGEMIWRNFKRKTGKDNYVMNCRYSF